MIIAKEMDRAHQYHPLLLIQLKNTPNAQDQYVITVQLILLEHFTSLRGVASFRAYGVQLHSIGIIYLYTFYICELKGTIFRYFLISKMSVNQPD